MKDQARDASIVMASCYDERHPPENVLDGNGNTFWITTGMFPQEFVMAFPSNMSISKITTLSLDVNKLLVEKCDHPQPDAFEKVFEVALSNRQDRLQTEVHSVNIRAKYLRFTLLSGHGDFATVNRVSVIGEPAEAAPASAAVPRSGSGGAYDTDY